MFEHVNVWHSHLAAACEKAPRGRLLITLLSHPQASRYAGRPAYARLRVEGDTTVRKYQVESEEIRTLLESIEPDSQIYIQASGGKDDQVLAAWTVEGKPIPQPVTAAVPTTAAPAPARTAQAQTVPAPAADAEPAPNQQRDTIAGDFWACLLEATRMVDKFEKRVKRRIRPEEVQLAAALHSQMDGVRKLSRRPPADPSPTPDT